MVVLQIDSDELCSPPEVCGPDAEDSKQRHLLAHTTGDNDTRMEQFLKRDKPLLAAIVAMVLLMNIPRLGHILYPFQIFSTWIHESSHGAAAILAGGGISKLLIYPDTSGLAWTFTDGSNWSRGFVASAGYGGTAVLGMVLLLFRRTHRGPTVGIIGIGCLMLFSCLLYVRNTFALIMLPIMAIVFILCAWKLKAKDLTYLYSFLAATCSFNAVDNISELYGPVGYVNGQESTSDAHSVAEYWGGTYVMWATIWLIFALVCSAVGLLFAFDGHTLKQEQKQQQHGGQKASAPAASDIEMPGASIITATAVPIITTTATAVPIQNPKQSGATTPVQTHGYNRLFV